MGIGVTSRLMGIVCALGCAVCGACSPVTVAGTTAVDVEEPACPPGDARCDGKQPAAPPAPQSPPTGTYVETCRACDTAGDRLTCECQRIDGAWWKAELDLPCAVPISNCDGQLRCGDC